MMERSRFMHYALSALLLIAVVGACAASRKVGQESGTVPEPTETGIAERSTATITSTIEPTPSPTPEAIATLTPAELQQYQPNELGQIMVLMYHVIDDSGEPYTRTAEQFRGDLQWLYDNDFYLIPMRDYVQNQIDAPAGKKPVVLTFDDSSVSQFRYISDGTRQRRIDPNSAVGILNDFTSQHPDFGKAGLFAILPNAPFAWPDAEEQQVFAQEKLKWLLDNGFEVGNHTLNHANFREIPEEQIRVELAEAVLQTQTYVPDASIDVIALPFGVYPPGGDDTVLRGFEYQGEQFQFDAALMVGANPAPSPVHVEYDPYWIPRIQTSDEELQKWFQFVSENPGMVYVSDGNPESITIPEEIHPWLIDTLDESQVGDKTVIRY